MVYRFSWIAGITAIALAFWQLSSVLRGSVVATPWQVSVLAATLLGVGITWITVAYRAPSWVIIAANIGVFVILVGLIVAPDTLFGILPTQETWNTIASELKMAFGIIRHGVEPVRPVPGLILLVSLLFWTLGFLLTAGLLNDRPFVALLTPLIVAVQFAIIDRKPKSLAHVAVFILAVAFVLIAIRADERDRGTGRLQRVNASTPPSRRPTPAIALLVSVTLIAGLVVVGLIGSRVPSDGFVTWRSPSGYVDGYSGGASYNPFTDIKAGLIAQTDNPLFVAEIEGAVATTVRFRTVTLDVYRDGRWATDRIRAFPLDEEPWIDDNQRYRGQTTQIRADITIQNLSQPWLPAPSTPSDAQGVREGDTRTIRVRRLDGSLSFQDPTYEGMQYTVWADLPTYTPRMIAQLARTESGDLSPLFQAAEDDGQIIPTLDEPNEAAVLDNEEFWIEIPDDLGPRVSALAAARTSNMATNFEKALALEHYFRLSGQFIYDADVPSEYTTGDVSDWLTDEENPYARHGYCEQFATAMALMGRSAGIPSRVVLGFTPGETGDGNSVQVRDKNAHAWVEMWMPSYGWMAFDPTPRSGYAAPTANESLAEILDFSLAEYGEEIPDPEVAASDGETSAAEGPLSPRDQRQPGFAPIGGASSAESSWLDLPSWVDWLGAVAGLIAAAALMIPAAKWWRRRRQLARLKQGDIAAAWEDITDRLADLGDPVPSSATPLETAKSIDASFLPLAHTYGETLYGERESTTAVIERATTAHTQALHYVAVRYTTPQRVIAAFRPTGLISAWSALFRKRNGNR
jgi:transglutaminase-like putative cysteine protease